MQRKAYVSGVAALLAALLAGCTSSSDDGGRADGSNPGDSGTASVAAEPGRYRTLPEPCGVVGEETLGSLLPGIRQITDKEQREKAHEGTPTLTYDTDRKVGCRWKVESAEATDHLLIDLERVVSYNTSVSDEREAQQLFEERQEAAGLPAPASSAAGGGENVSLADQSGSTASPGTSAATGSPTAPADDAPSAGLQPRLLDDLGDEAFLDDELGNSGSTARQRTVTVAFRTSNVIVTIAYEEQPATVGTVPDSEEMQGRARKLAARLADSLA